MEKSAPGCNQENAARASFEVGQLIALPGKHHTIATELIESIQIRL